MKHPNRRILSFYLRSKPIWQRLTNIRSVELHGSCRHVWEVDIAPDRHGHVPIPIIAPCLLCPKVPDARVNSYVEGGAVPAIRRIS